jgi:hypothetical protein
MSGTPPILAQARHTKKVTEAARCQGSDGTPVDMNRTRATPPDEAAGARPGPQGNQVGPESGPDWVRWLFFAAVLMTLLGAFHAIQGLIALFNSEYYFVGPRGLSVHLAHTTCRELRASS